MEHVKTVMFKMYFFDKFYHVRAPHARVRDHGPRVRGHDPSLHDHVRDHGRRARGRVHGLHVRVHVHRARDHDLPSRTALNSRGGHRRLPERRHHTSPHRRTLRTLMQLLIFAKTDTCFEWYVTYNHVFSIDLYHHFPK